MKNVKALSRFNLGLIISLALTLVALEWKSYSVLVNLPIGGEEVVKIEDDWMPISVKVKKPEPKKKIVKKKPSQVIKVVDKKIVTVTEPAKKEEPVLDFNPDDLWDEPTVVDPDPIIDIPQVFPQFPGGEPALLEFVYKNVEYDQRCKEVGAEGTVLVQFVVGKDGKTRDAKILRGIFCKPLEKEVLNMIENMPTWTPGKQKGHPVSCYFRLPVKFSLKP